MSLVDAFHRCRRGHQDTRAGRGVHQQSRGKLCAGRDLQFVGGMINRALTEGCHRVALAILAEHKMRMDEDGSKPVDAGYHARVTSVVKEMVYLGGINVEQRNHKGETAMVIACKEVCAASLPSAVPRFRRPR